jgi:hypothetical protein
MTLIESPFLEELLPTFARLILGVISLHLMVAVLATLAKLGVL